MKRRSKEDMDNMRNLVEYYLIINNNDPHKAYNCYIKEYLLNGNKLPYYINGLNDFNKVSKEIIGKNKIKEEKLKKEKSIEIAKDFLITRYLDDKEGLKKALKENKGKQSYDNLVEFWMILQEDKPKMSNGLYISLQGILY